MDLKKKYSGREVEALIRELKNEYEKAAMKQKDRIFELKSGLSEMEKQLEEYRKREAQISKALTFAVQKAAEIEESAKKKYSMEIEHLRAFHEKWRNYYNQLILKYPVDNNIREIQEFNRQMNSIFSGNLENITEAAVPADIAGAPRNENSKVYERERRRVGNAENAVRKVADVLTETEPEERYEKIVKTATKKKPSKAKEELAYYKQDAFDNQESKFVPPKNIVNYLDKEDEAPENQDRIVTVEKRKVQSGNIGRDALGGKVYAAPIPPSESGFSFEEALNPTQDLEDIMKDLGLIFDGDLDI